ncbi:hypothetical protein [Mucilaginibacter polytrichastri]|uniref:Uncharacterized protein n=1 Tax=Mucilaginibacter polytrichastri TaxID=1302689 RepID=A0A1Q6A1S6_9SPHI|nr:hypothetical protein [Mucilaginibacter polytrichastri]OKS87963.1 hypothetical protein RG47T_3427 [Mucilaginibacter polytrichastri]SFT23389.1 hypothetical protein SAMN04487890_12063 [Mucilaginibacter polytrichastri]
MSTNTTQQANDERHYLVLVVAIAIGLAGVFLRFAGEAPIWSIVSNTILVLAVILGLRTVFGILK